MKKFKIVVLGCKVNTFEGQSIAQSLLDAGYLETKEQADIYVVLTCAVTNMAESKTRKRINQIKRENSNAILCVVGCYVQINHHELMNDGLINILVGSSNKDKVAKYIKDFEKNKKYIYAVDEEIQNLKFDNLNINQFNYQTRAYLKVQDGCNQYCSYCIIPYARGKERSIELYDAVNQATKLVSNNHQEIVLAGIHTGRYLDNQHNNLYDLLNELCKIKGLKRIRLSSIEITEITDDIIELMVSNNQIARHLHIPLQSGSDEVLKSMNRPYDTALFMERIKYIRSRLKGVSISTDLIVGYPVETRKLFSKTYSFLIDAAFSFIHVFPFSSKKGTKAASLKSVVCDDEKKQRVKICTDLSNKLYYKYQSQFIGETLEVLVEKNGFGHSSEYIPVKIDGYCPINEMMRVFVKEVVDNQLVGEQHVTK